MTRRVALGLSLAVVLLPATALPAPQPADRSETWKQYCSVCHGDDGMGQTEEGKKKKARDLSAKKWQDTVDDARLTKSITKGRDKMPDFGKKLNADQIKALVAEIRTLAK